MQSLVLDLELQCPLCLVLEFGCASLDVEVLLVDVLLHVTNLLLMSECQPLHFNIKQEEP